MAYDKKSTRDPDIPPGTFDSTDPQVIINFLIESMAPYWAVKMKLFRWARYHSIHVESSWVDQLRDAIAAREKKPGP